MVLGPSAAAIVFGLAVALSNDIPADTEYTSVLDMHRTLSGFLKAKSLGELGLCAGGLLPSFAGLEGAGRPGVVFGGGHEPVNPSVDSKRQSPQSEVHSISRLDEFSGWETVDSVKATSLAVPRPAVTEPTITPEAEYPLVSADGSPPQPWQALDGHKSSIVGLAFDPSGLRLFSAGYGDCSLRSWDISSGFPSDPAKTKSPVASFAVAPDGGRIYTAEVSGDVTAWTISNGLIGGPEPVAGMNGDTLALSPDGRLLAVTGAKQTIAVCDTRTGTILAGLDPGRRIRTLIFSPGAHYLMAAGFGNAFRVWSTRDWKRKTYGISGVSRIGTILAADFSLDSKTLVTGHDDGSVVVIDVEQARELRNVFVPYSRTADIKISPDGLLLATAHRNLVLLRKLADGQDGISLTWHSAPVTRIAFTASGRTMASGDRAGRIILWRGGTNTPQSPLHLPADVHSPKSDHGAELGLTGGLRMDTLSSADAAEAGK